MQAIKEKKTGEKFVWELTAVDTACVQKLASQCSLSEPIARVLYNRGYTTPQHVFRFISMTLDAVADGMLLKGAQDAADRILRAVNDKERILIFGDYDVDGITSSAIMLVSLLPLNAKVNFFLPNRVHDGYGLSEKIVKKAARSGYTLIVTVDNGMSAHDAVRAAKERNLDVIITDHHRPHGTLPEADIVVNPLQPGCKYPYKEFAGVGVVFKIMQLVYDRLGKQLPDKVYELLMLGTIADVVPLVNENRYWVQYGLAKSNEHRSRAMHMLLTNGKLEHKQSIDSRDIGFMIAPQLNALGRLDDPRDGVIFLISNQFEDVMRIGQKLKSINEERKRVDRRIYEEIEAAILSGTINLEKENLIMAASEKWPAGVVGLVAGRLVQNYGRPSILFHVTDTGIVKGSCRSIPAFNIFDALDANKDLLLTFGGHACAAGLSLRQENVSKLKARLEEKIARELSPEDLVQKISLDAIVRLPEITRSFVADLKKMEPFGHQNVEPIFWVRGVTLVKQPRLFKDRHVKCMVFDDGVIKPVLFFNRPELYACLCDIGDMSFDLAVHVMENEWQQQVTIELQGIDIACKGAA